jgi:hypothetical protein
MSNKRNHSNQEWVQDVIDAAESVVIGYEKYLLDEFDHKQLAKLVKVLRNLLPMDSEEE